MGERTPAATERRRPYDRAFEPAVAAGFLTVEQAAARGNRQALAQQTAERHGLAHDLGLAVADNRLTLQGAVLEQRSREAATRARFTVQGPTPAQSPVHPVLWIAIALLLALAGWAAWGDSGRAPYLAAQRRVQEFERGLDPVRIDYDDPVYGKALDELGRVGPASRFARPARTLESEIRGKIEDYHRRARAAAAERQRQLELTHERRRTFAAASRLALLRAPLTAPECETHAHPRGASGAAHRH